jgi:DNA-binding transcriptional regulator of glucitol operon
MDSLLAFFIVFAALWVLQLYGTAKQGQHFMRQVSRLRPLGETAIGASSMDRLKRRAYVCLAADETDRVTGAIELSGVTIFSRATDVEELVGRTLVDVARDDSQDRRALAARMAAKTLLGEELDVPIKARRKWTIAGPGRTERPTTPQPGSAVDDEGPASGPSSRLPRSPRSDGEDTPEVRG